MSGKAIAANGLVRRFGRVVAVNDLTFEVETGSVTGLLGPNGAGKSTTIHMLLGLLRRHGGEASVLGMDPARSDVAIRSRTGFVQEDPRGEPRFSVSQQLAFMRAFRPTWDHELERDLMGRFELNPRASCGALSRGQRAKLALISALAFRPELLVLDDPTSGLDPLARREFIEGIVSVLAEEGRTVFFSTHHMEDIERVADRIVMVREGHCIYSESMDVIRSCWRRMRLSFGSEAAPEKLNVPGMFRWVPDGRAGRVVFNAYTEASEAVLSTLNATVEQEPFALEDIYVELVKHGSGSRP